MEEWGRHRCRPRAALWLPSPPQQRGRHPDTSHAPAASSLQRPVWLSAGRQCDWRRQTQAATQAGPKGVGTWKPESSLWEWEALMEMVKASQAGGQGDRPRTAWLLLETWHNNGIHLKSSMRLNPFFGRVTPLNNGMVAYLKKRKSKKNSPIKWLLWLAAGSCNLHRPKGKKKKNPPKSCAFIELGWQDLTFLTDPLLVKILIYTHASNLIYKKNMYICNSFLSKWY